MLQSAVVLALAGVHHHEFWSETLARVGTGENWVHIHRWGSRRHVQGQHSCGNPAGKGCDLSPGQGDCSWAGSYRRAPEGKGIAGVSWGQPGALQENTLWFLVSARGSQALDAVPLPGTCGRSAGRSGERPGSPGGTASRENKALRSQKPALTPGRTLGLCPQTPRLSPQPWAGGAERGRDGRQGRRDGGGREAEGGGEEAGAAAGGGGGSIKGRGAGARSGAERWPGGARCAWRWPGGPCWRCWCSSCAGSGPTGTSLCSGPRGGGRSQVMPAAPRPDRGVPGRERGHPHRGWRGALGCWCHQLSRGYPSMYAKSLIYLHFTWMMPLGRPKLPKSSRGSVPSAAPFGPNLFVLQFFWAGSRSWQGAAEAVASAGHRDSVEGRLGKGPGCRPLSGCCSSPF